MRDVIITYPFPLGRATGGARMTREIARSLGRLGHRVRVVTVSCDLGMERPRRPADDAHLGYEFDEDLARDRVTVVRVPPHRRHWLLDGLPVQRAVKRLLAEQPADIVLSYHHEGAFLDKLAARAGARRGIIATWQSYRQFLESPLVARPLRRLANQRLIVKPFLRAEVLFATSEFTKAELVDAVGVDPERIHIMPLGVRTEFLAIPRPAPETIRRILFFGRVIESKGVFDLLRALGALAERGVDHWRLRIVGLGRHDLADEVAEEAGIGDLVDIADAVDDAGLVAELAAADLVALPSHFEAFGLAFAEAQAAALPVVAYDAGSVPEVVEDGVTGWLAPLHDIEQLELCLERALTNPRATQLAGLAARERIQSLFNWERTAEIIDHGIEAVLATEPPW